MKTDNDAIAANYPQPCERCKKLERELLDARQTLVRWHKLMFPRISQSELKKMREIRDRIP